MLASAHSVSLSQPHPFSERTIRAEQWLIRYPNLSKPELGRLIETLPYLPPVELSLMLADDRLSAKLEAFHNDHGHLLKAPRTWLLASLIGTGAISAAILWWAMSIAPAL